MNELIIQINNANAMKMDTNLQDKDQHCGMHCCIKAILWGLCKVLLHGVARYLSLYQEKTQRYNFK